MSRLSIVTPFHNEEQCLPRYRQQLLAALEAQGVAFEVILVDDHSSDGGSGWARQWAVDDPRVRYLRLSRNFGAHAAVAAGLTRAEGDCVVMLAADLQDPPEVLGTLLGYWREGYHVVFAHRGLGQRKGGWSRAASALYYRLMRWLALPEMPVEGAHFALLDRKVVDALNEHPEKNANLMALVVWLGFRQITIECPGRPRGGGRSKWNLSRKLKLLADSIVGFSYLPIRLASLVGVCVSLAGFAYAVMVMVNWFIQRPVSGWSALMVVVLILGGFQSLMLGILGEYLWRTYDESRGRPRYVIEDEFAQALRPPGPRNRADNGPGGSPRDRAAAERRGG